jgi:hypothetical protein
LEDSWLGASPDGIVTLTTVSGEETKILLEIKCPPIATYNSVDELKKKKPEYIAQVNGTMGCFILNDENILLTLCAYTYIFAYTQV